ncbi:hypothetical protein DND62_29740, partial [Pseudomonas syringae pv. pisi]
MSIELGAVDQILLEPFEHLLLRNAVVLKKKKKKICEKTISVNNPLIYKNITFYQTDWNIKANRL